MGFQVANLLLATVNFEPCHLAWKSCLSTANCQRHGGSVVDHTLDYQSRDRKINSPLLRSFGRFGRSECNEVKPRSRLRMTSLLVGR